MIREAAFACCLAVDLAGCQSASTDSFVGPAGTAVQSTKCSQSPSACFKTANEVCHGPYSVVESHSYAGGLVADLLPGPVTWYSMSYQCGPSNGAYPQFPFTGTPYVPPTVTTCSHYHNTTICTGS
jgi:hypothetical protein